MRSLGFFCFILCSTQIFAKAPEETLASYLKKDRKSIAPLKESEVVDGLTQATLTSQKWRSEEEVTPNVWTHRLAYSDPKSTKDCHLAYLYVTGGDYTENQAVRTSDLLKKVSSETGCWSIALDLVPNQALTFFKDGQPRIEDNILAFSFVQFWKTKDSSWLALFPMVKSVTIAMDELEKKFKDATKKSLGGFIISGQSKRGWTGWLTAAHDARVKGVIPIVIDLLNAAKSFKHHYARYQSWSPALSDYVSQGIVAKVDHPDFGRLMHLIDPYTYFPKLKMPKLVINSANDQFFVPDSSKFYYNDLKGDKWLQYVPNVGHHIDEQKEIFLPTVVTFVNLLKANKPLPFAQIEKTTNGYSIKSELTPNKVTLFNAHNKTSADFRFAQVYPRYEATELKAAKGSIAVSPPNAAGWHARFVTAEYTIPSVGSFKVSSQVLVEEVEDRDPKPVTPEPGS